MPDHADCPAVLDQCLTDALLDFERLDDAWPRGRTAIERAEIGRQRSVALLDVETLQLRIMRARAATLADAAVQLRRLMVSADVEPRPHALLAPPDARSLVASVLAVVEREVDGTVGPS